MKKSFSFTGKLVLVLTILSMLSLPPMALAQMRVTGGDVKISMPLTTFWTP